MVEVAKEVRKKEVYRQCRVFCDVCNRGGEISLSKLRMDDNSKSDDHITGYCGECGILLISYNIHREIIYV